MWTIREALKAIPGSEHMQPEGRDVADAYREGLLGDATQNLYLIAFLLHEVNATAERAYRQVSKEPQRLIAAVADLDR